MPSRGPQRAGARRGARRRRPRGAGGMPDRAPAKSYEPPSGLELLILRTEPLQLETEDASRRRRELRSGCASRRSGDHAADGSAEDRQRSFRNALENSADRTGHVPLHGLTDGVTGSTDQPSQELIQLAVVGDVEQLGREIHLVDLVERFRRVEGFRLRGDRFVEFSHRLAPGSLAASSLPQRLEQGACHAMVDAPLMVFFQRSSSDPRVMGARRVR
jgi:hypothetical protein